MTPADAALERDIESAKLAAYGAQTPEESRAALDKLKALIDQRSPERVAEIERQRRLRD